MPINLNNLNQLQQSILNDKEYENIKKYFGSTDASGQISMLNSLINVVDETFERIKFVDDKDIRNKFFLNATEMFTRQFKWALEGELKKPTTHSLFRPLAEEMMKPKFMDSLNQEYVKYVRNNSFYRTKSQFRNGVIGLLGLASVAVGVALVITSFGTNPVGWGLIGLGVAAMVYSMTKLSYPKSKLIFKDQPLQNKVFTVLGKLDETLKDLNQAQSPKPSAPSLQF